MLIVKASCSGFDSDPSLFNACGVDDSFFRGDSNSITDTLILIVTKYFVDFYVHYIELGDALFSSEKSLKFYDF